MTYNHQRSAPSPPTVWPLEHFHVYSLVRSRHSYFNPFLPMSGIRTISQKRKTPMKTKSLRIFEITLMGLAMTFAAAAFAVDTQTTIYNFQNKATGANPESGVIADPAGNLYGTTAFGGSCTLTKQGCGIVFELSPSSSGGWRGTHLSTLPPRNPPGYPPPDGGGFA